MKQYLSLCLFAGALLAPSAAEAFEKPTVLPFNMPNESFFSGVSRNCEWAVFTPPTGTSCEKTYVVDVMKGEIIELPVTHLVQEDGTETEVEYPSTTVTASVTEDGKMIGGSWEDEPAVYKDGKWYLLEYPNDKRKDEYTGYACAVEHISKDGRYMLGMAYNPSYNIKPVLWVDGKLTKLENLPDRDWQNHLVETGDANMRFISISDDSRYLLGGMSLNFPGNGSCYFVYDLENKTYDIIALNELNDMISGDVVLQGSELDGSLMPSFSPDGSKVGGTALLVFDNGTPFPDDVLVPFVYDVKTKETKFYMDKADDRYKDVCAVMDDGSIVGTSDASTPAHSVAFRVNDSWYDLESILSQTYGMTFLEATGSDSLSGTAFGISPDGRTLVAMLPGARSKAYMVHLPDRSFFEAAAGINLMKGWQCDPVEHSSIARLDRTHVKFERSSNPIENFDITLSAEGEEPVKATEVAAYNASRTIWRIEFPSTQLKEGKEYTVTIPAGTFVMDNTGMTNEDISFVYEGREEKPLEVLSTRPADGASMMSIGPKNMAGFDFDHTAKIADKAQAYLYQNGNSTPLSPLSLVASGNTVFAYPPTDRMLPKGTEYEIVIPAGAVVDITGYCPAAEYRLKVKGSYERVHGGDEVIIFKEDFSNTAEALTNFMQYEGDHRTPRKEMANLGFDADNTPWNFSTRENSSTNDYFAMSHSMYEDGGAADDWMVTPQLDIKNPKVTLAFDVQGYQLTKSDRLKVMVWACDDVYNSLDPQGTLTGLIRKEGTVIYDEVADPGASASGVAGEWTHVNLELGDFAGKKVYIAFINENENQSAVLVDNIVVRNNGEFFVGTHVDESVVNEETIEIPAYITFDSEDTNVYTEVEATLTSGDFKSVYKAEGLQLTTDKAYEFSFADRLPLERGVKNNYSVHVALKDGEGNVYENSMVGTVANLTHQTTKRVVLEEGTGAWCGNCPMGIIAIEHMEQLLPDNFIPVSIHNGDAYAYPAYENGFLGFNAYPNGRVNRKEAILRPMTDKYEFESTEGGIVTFQDAVLSELAVPALGEIKIESATYNGSKVDVKAEALFALEGEADYSVFTLLLEDNLVGMQTNYLSGNDNPIFGEWGTSGGHVRTSYRDVARGIAGISFHGESGLIPGTFVADTPYEFSTTLNLPTGVKPENSKVVLMLIDGRTGFVVNAARAELKEGVGIESVGSDGNVTFEISGGTITANGSEDVEIYSIAGQRMANGSLVAGVYVVRAQGAVAKVVVK